MCRYSDLKNKHGHEINAFPMAFAFSDKQFEEGMKKLGLKVTEADKIYSAPGGGFYLKTDSKKLKDLIDNKIKEMDEAIKADKTGHEFIYDMFNYELGNHEFCITMSTSQTLEALGLTNEEIKKSTALSAGLEKAMKNQMKGF